MSAVTEAPVVLKTSCDGIFADLLAHLDTLCAGVPVRFDISVPGPVCIPPLLDVVSGIEVTGAPPGSAVYVLEVRRARTQVVLEGTVDDAGACSLPHPLYPMMLPWSLLRVVAPGVVRICGAVVHADTRTLATRDAYTCCGVHRYEGGALTVQRGARDTV